MKLVDAYKQALKQQIQPLVDEGKIQLLTTVEELAEDLTKAVFSSLKEGAKLSDTVYDDVAIPPVVDLLEGRVLKYVDKIDGQEG